MGKNTKKNLLITGIFIGTTIAVFSVFLLWFYKTPPSQLKDKIGRIVPLPIAFVGSHPISTKVFLERVNTAQTIYGSTPNIDKSTMREQVLSQIAEEIKTHEVANKFGISVSAKELDEQFNSIKGQASQQSAAGLAVLLEKYNLSENQFKNEVLKPELELTDLMLWFNSQRTLNPNEFSLADSLRSQMVNASSSTSTFSSLVQQYSQDDNSKSLDGDLGFLEIAGLLPEFRQALDSAKNGDVVVAPSRYGIHIFKIGFKDSLGSKNASRIQIRQIFLKTEDFNVWYTQETKNITIKKLI